MLEKILKKKNSVRDGVRFDQSVRKNVTVIGEGMKRVETAASKIKGATILNDMPIFSGNKDQITSQMMVYNRRWNFGVGPT